MLTQKKVKELFNYSDGQLIWKVSHRRSVKGQIAGYVRKDEYLSVGIDSKEYLVHRVIFLWHHGYLPELIDHEKGMSNKIGNLRECTKSQNGLNSKRSIINTSGVKGVYWCKKIEKWVAKFMMGGKRFHVGVYLDIEDARKAIEKQREIHQKEFANHG